MRGDLLWHASSNGRKYFSALIVLVASFLGRGSAFECSLVSTWAVSSLISSGKIVWDSDMISECVKGALSQLCVVTEPFNDVIAVSQAFFSWPWRLISLSARIFSKARTMNISFVLFWKLCIVQNSKIWKWERHESDDNSQSINIRFSSCLLHTFAQTSTFHVDLSVKSSYSSRRSIEFNSYSWEKLILIYFFSFLGELQFSRLIFLSSARQPWMKFEFEKLVGENSLSSFVVLCCCCDQSNGSSCRFCQHFLNQWWWIKITK